MAELTLVGLRVVLEVARSGSLTAAAATLGVTQSAVSRQVAATEAAVGAPLFTRRPRGVTLTLAGEVLVRHARSVVGQVSTAELELAGLQDRVAGRLLVGAYPTASAVLVPRAMASVRAAHPALDVQLWESASPAQVRRLRAGRIEVAVVASGGGLPDYDFGGLRAEPLTFGPGVGLGVAVGAQHRLAGLRHVRVEDLVDELWVVGAGSDEEPQFGAWPTLSEPRVVFEARGWQTRLGLVAAGLGISVMPGLAAASVPRGVVWLPVLDPGRARQRQTLVLTALSPGPRAAAMALALHDVAVVLGDDWQQTAF